MKKVTLKIDDFWGKDDGKFFEIIKKYNIKISLGIVGIGLETCAAEKAEFIKQNLGLIEPFNHSYWHVIAHPVKEFFKTSREYQLESLKKTNEVIKSRLDFEVETVGFPANACDETTITLLQSEFQFKNIYHVVDSYNYNEVKNVCKNIINVTADFGGNECHAVQLHPFARDFDLATFEKNILAELKKETLFIFPSEL
jgi:hypothetical protein